jgi:hypothetical protein
MSYDAPLSPEQVEYLRPYGEPQPSRKLYYKTVHPLADQTDLLGRLNISPAECIVCDLYWPLADGVAFVSVAVTDQPFASFWTEWSDDIVVYKFYVSTKQTPLTTATIDAVLTWLTAWFNSAAVTKSRIVQTISDKDIAL